VHSKETLQYIYRSVNLKVNTKNENFFAGMSSHVGPLNKQKKVTDIIEEKYFRREPL